MASAARFSLILGLIALILAVVVGATYMLSLRPTWYTDAVVHGVPARLADPTTSTEELRRIALDSHRTVVAAFFALDVAVRLLVGLIVLAGVGFLYVAYRLRHHPSASSTPAL